MMTRSIPATALVAVLATGCGSPDVDRSRTALAFRSGDELELSFADGPQTCDAPLDVVAVGPSCDAPSWRLIIPVPASQTPGEPYDVNTLPDEAREGIRFGMQEGECHSGEPVIDSGHVILGPQENGAIDVELSVVARSSFDPSGTYRAVVCN